jgi:chorismate mutase
MTKNELLQKLLTRRVALRDAIAEASTSPASWSITGSVAQTAQKISEMRAELANIDREIKALLQGDDAGIRRIYPNYS